MTVGSSLFLRDGATFKGEVVLARREGRGPGGHERLHLREDRERRRHDGRQQPVPGVARISRLLSSSSSPTLAAVSTSVARWRTASTSRARPWRGTCGSAVERQRSGCNGSAPERGAASRLLPPTGRSEIRHGETPAVRAGDPPPRLILRNTQVGALQDSSDAWPPDLDLEGFKYDRLGGLGARAQTTCARARRSSGRTGWSGIARSAPSPTRSSPACCWPPGIVTSAEAIQYAGKVRQRAEEKGWGAWLWQSVWGGVAGYGVGLYTFRVLWWVIGLTVLGAVVLWFSPRARAHGVLWVFGASLHRLLPIVELNKEFKDFFDNPSAGQLRRAA